MRLSDLTWIASTLLVLSAEGSAVAQSAPPAASDPTLAHIQQSGVSVGPQLEAARAGKAKKGDAPVDLNGLANRQTAAGSASGNALAIPSAAGAPIQSSSGSSLQGLHGEAVSTSTSAGPAARVAPSSDAQEGKAPASGPALRPAAVLRGQINPAARACYQSGPDSKSGKAGRLMVLIKVTPTGDVDSVNVANNVGVASSVVDCITGAARAAKFAPSGPNGATVPAAFTFGTGKDAATPGAAHATAAPARATKASASPASSDAAH